ncbi:MAG: hypothetical protein PSX80_09425 [bacterium]|nr:hypothetical protein [bacterium]
MGSTKHEKSFVDFEKPYEQNVIGFQGIVYFAIGLFLLIVITFGLMWALLGVLEDQAKVDKGSNNPMLQSEKERLPVEPRIQAAPGFGVDGPNGRVNLELMAPQSEWWELQKQYQEIWSKGRVDRTTGAVTALPIDEAKQKLLGRNSKARTGPEAEKVYAESRLRFSDASSGRMATDRKR